MAKSIVNVYLSNKKVFTLRFNTDIEAWDFHGYANRMSGVEWVSVFPEPKTVPVHEAIFLLEDCIKGKGIYDD